MRIFVLKTPTFVNNILKKVIKPPKPQYQYKKVPKA